jgi:hypothetical protein
VAPHANGVAEEVIALEKLVHDKVLGMSLAIRRVVGGSEKTRHVVSKGFDDVVLELGSQFLVNKVV